MGVVTTPFEAPTLVSGETRQVSSRRNFDWIMTGLSAWLIGGMYLDGWAHFHGKVDESFFTPWHGVLYSGLLAVAIFLGIALYRNHRNGSPWLKSLPEGYNLSLLGAGIFAIGGVVDLVWHTLFGIEESVDATISPSHLLLALGMILIVSGAARSQWRLTGPAHKLLALLPMLLSATFVLSVLTFFTPYAHPFVDAWATTSTALAHSLDLTNELDVFLGEALGAASVFLQSGLLMGVMFVMMRRSVLPFGSFAVVFTLNAALMSVLHDQYRFIPVAAVAGLLADSLYYWLKPSLERTTELRLFAVFVPAGYFLLYFLVLAAAETIWWSTHMWSGTVVLSGVVGLLLSYVLLVPGWQQQGASPQLTQKQAE